ncbi:hypothetical protein [Rhizomonospora bruguierae]|uniref:hypothetical protein n=1 Tax=Rhizomonospora bruguierae TaxID=1581705 RepID=UPI001BCAE593|nr:hypothetical protein [Micromonospora sp. NBRC 107566]
MTILDPPADGTAEQPALAATATIAAPDRRPRSATRPTLLLLSVGIVAAWIAVVVSAAHLHVNPAIHEAALFLHLAAVVLGFGAVLTVDWVGLLWILRQRTLSAVAQAAHTAHLPIWLGLAGLAVTGALLSPHVSSPRTAVKLGAVLIVALNGLYAGQIQQRLSRYGDGTPVPRALLLRSMTAAGISQAGWWTAVIIGFLNAQT